ncbi:MAG: imidazoleglycerol-phosphate dehydratase [Methanothrix sp.]|nr:imidazoleglycerol-phosphate dehydratase [Methanothrix sp.]
MPSSKKRETKETCIEAFLNIKGQGQIHVETGIELLDEILLAIGRSGGFDLKVMAKGDAETGDHHTTEDVAITLGSVLAEEVQGGIGSSTVPSGESLATAAVRFGEPGYQGNFSLKSSTLSGMDLENFGHLLRALAYNGRFTLAISATGGDDRSQIEAMSTALGRAIKKAARDHT